MLDQARLKEVLHYNPETGEFRFLSKRVGRRPQTKKCRYGLHVDGVRYKAHRLAWLYMIGEWPRGEIDHIDRDSSNNKFSNLREASREENTVNVRRPTSKRPHTNVELWEGKSCAAYRVGVKGLRQKRFTTKDYGSKEAALLYATAWAKKMRREVHGEFLPLEELEEPQMFHFITEPDIPRAYHQLMHTFLLRGAEIENTRNGRALVLPSPLAMSIGNPRKRVLSDPRRNANPIFHLVEALWMLAGSNDLNFLSYYNQRMKTYSDDGATLNAAYGHRWRKHFGRDQLLTCSSMLRKNPHDRRVVLSMWDPYNDLDSVSLDIPCNTQAMFRIVDGSLNMTTVNRSNDIVFGLLGANCVHLTVMQEWLAASVGVEVGQWNHMSNNAHVYEEHWPLLKAWDYTNPPELPPHYPDLHPFKLVEDPMRFLAECEELVGGKQDYFKEPFFDGTVAPMVQSWDEYKGGNIKEAIYLASCIDAADWNYATTKWYERAKEKKNGS